MAYLFPRFTVAPVRCAPLRHEISPLFSLFDEVTRDLRQIDRVARRVPRPFNPKFDVKEGKTEYILEGEVPGFQEKDLSIEWKDNVLAVRGRQETVVRNDTESKDNTEAQQQVDQETSTAATTTSETSSVKSHQATVEDETEEGFTAVENPTSEKAEQAVASTEATQESQIAAPTQPTEPEVQHWVSERRTGQFLRQFSFPHNSVDHEAIKASLQSGILKIVVPKAEAPVSRRINIE